MDPGKNGAIVDAGEGGDPARQAWGGTGSLRQTLEKVRRSQDVGGHRRRAWHNINSLRLDNHDCEPCFTVSICFRRINHMAVKNHLHLSSGVREVVSGTIIHFYGTKNKNAKAEAVLRKVLIYFSGL